MSIKLNLIGKYRWKGNNAKDYNVNNPLGKKRLREREKGMWKLAKLVVKH